MGAFEGGASPAAEFGLFVVPGVEVDEGPAREPGLIQASGFEQERFGAGEVSVTLGDAGQLSKGFGIEGRDRAEALPGGLGVLARGIEGVGIGGGDTGMEGIELERAAEGIGI